MAKYEDFVDETYTPEKRELKCEFYIKPKTGVDLKWLCGGVAAESSIGTWTSLTTVKEYMTDLAATVYDIKKKGKGAEIKIAYPPELFEPGNIPNILSSVAGNIFGLKEIKHLRMTGFDLPKKLVQSFEGPEHGIKGVRKITGKKTPLIGTIVKPKLGLKTKDHAKVAYDAWVGGCDIVKDDENLSSQNFNKFEKRLQETVKMKEKAEQETGEKKIYMINVTAETKEMLERTKKDKESGNEYLMVDIITCGWSALQTLRENSEGLVIHAHRAGHAAFTKLDYHGISMPVVATIARTIGVDQLHIGTAVGKMSEDKEDVLANIEACKKDYYGHKKVFPVASGGLNPLNIPDLFDIFGNDVIIQAGGGIHGNPLGTKSGATAMKQALEAALENETIEEKAKKHKELKAALDKWG